MSIEPEGQTQTLESIEYRNGSLRLLDQRKLPLETVYVEIHTIQQIFDAIKEMRVRGAPAIAISAALGIAVAAAEKLSAGDFHGDAATAVDFLCESCAYLLTSRPTAVNLAKCLSRIRDALLAGAPGFGDDVAAVRAFTTHAEALFAEDVAINAAILRNGARHLRGGRAAAPGGKFTVLTLCNTGSLATARYGTALGVVRGLFYAGALARVFACETRPWNQGARLTVYECAREGMPCTLICDSAAAALMRRTPIDAVIVGADRVCRNGDTANKIGTYQLAVTAKRHGVRFYVAAPSTTLDPSTPNGAGVPIEERAASEITTDPITHTRVVAEGPSVEVWNPVFDITPAELITGGIITERGVFEPASSAPYYDVQAILGAA